MQAANNGYLDIVLLLLDKGADVNATDKVAHHASSVLRLML